MTCLNSVCVLFFFVRIGLFLPCIIFLSSCSACAETAPTSSSAPKNIDEAVEQLDAVLGDGIKRKITEGGVTAGDLHLSIGMWIRNEWGLWRGSPLAKHFNERGIEEVDAMSAIILETYIRKVRGLPLEIEEQIKRHKRFWESGRKIREYRAKLEAEALGSEGDPAGLGRNGTKIGTGEATKKE